jgi:hypothetical protein
LRAALIAGVHCAALGGAFTPFLVLFWLLGHFRWVIEAARRSANGGTPSGATKIIAAYALFHWEKRLNRLHFEALKSLKSVQKGP